MKHLTMIIAALLFALFATAQPPAPELLYRQTAPNPAFIKVAGITADFADSEDYVFVYSATTNRCYGYTKGFIPIRYLSQQWATIIRAAYMVSRFTRK